MADFPSGRHDAAREMLRRRHARESLIDFTSFTYPKYRIEPAHRLIAEKLDAVARRDIRRLMIFAPPQSGKEPRRNNFPISGG